MKTVISQLREQWRNPKSVVHRGEVIPFELVCQFKEGATSDELSGVCDLAPTDLLDFWKAARQADLFIDPQYGQWGLRIWSPAKSVEKTQQLRSASSTQLMDGDLVIGEFLGDADLLLVRCDPSAPDFASIVIALPLDARRDWPKPAKTFSDFLTTYAKESGDKFWDRAGTCQ